VLADVVVELVDSDGAVVEKTATDSNDAYAFVEVPLGD